MTQNTGRKLNIILAYSSYLLSGSLIFSPLHKSENIIISVLSGFLVGFLELIIIMSVYNQQKHESINRSFPSAVISLTSAILSCAASLMLITEVIKDTAYISNRGISLFYYIFLSLAILSVSIYLCLSHEKGIYRFCILAFFAFLFLYVISFFGFSTTKSFVFDMDFSQKDMIFSSALTGSLTGIFFAADTSVFIYCFKKHLTKHNGKLDSNALTIAYCLSFFMIGTYNLSTCFIFGSELTNSISDPDYALVKLLPGIDFTETISFLRIVSFLIKSSVYIYGSSLLIKKALYSTYKSTNLPIYIQYLLIPATVISLIIADKSLGYGAFQNLIYPCVILLSLLFITIFSFFQKKDS